MKSYPLVCSLKRLVAGVCHCVCSVLATSLVACSASNGALFDEAASMERVDEPSDLDAPATSASQTPSSEASSATPSSSDGSPDEAATDSPPDSEAPNDDDLPLSGDFPSAPVSGMPEPSPGDGEGPAEGEGPASEREGPVVVAVSPADGAIGVDNDQNIVIEFSAPMNREATEAAYQSESIPSGSVSFSWNEAGTELTIVPEAPLAYPVGPAPDEVPVRRVSFFISASATDVEGRSLPSPFESSFSLLRRVEFSLFALQDRDLSGSFRSNDTYGTGQCARGQINMCVGDVRVNGDDEQSRGFISFELTELPDEARSLEAELTLQITAMSGNPFAGLGGLVLEHARFDAIGAQAFAADALDEVGLIASAGGTGTTVSADVASAFIADRAERAMTQYRLRFEDYTDGDNNSDAIVSAWDTQTLDVAYLIP